MQGHIKRMLVTPELLAHMAVGTFRVVKNAVPEDARVVGAGYDSERACCELFLTHPSFAHITEGDPVPICDAPMFERVEQEDR